jgi:hypothetical protein
MSDRSLQILFIMRLEYSLGCRLYFYFIQYACVYNGGANNVARNSLQNLNYISFHTGPTSRLISPHTYPECPCGNGPQTVEHLIYDCIKLSNERQKLKAHISKEDTWPIGKSELVNKYLIQVTQFTNSIEYENL